jgi:hypothetical protein
LTLVTSATSAASNAANASVILSGTSAVNLPALTTYFGNTAGVGAAILTTPASYPAPLTNTFFSTSTITPPTTVVATTTQAATTAVVTAISNYIQSLLSIYQG